MAGVQDLFSPVQLAVPGVLLLLVLTLSNISRAAMVLFVAYFMLFFLIFEILFDTGVMSFVLLSRDFMMGASWFYCILGVFFLGVAWIFGVQWRSLISDQGHSFTPWPRKLDLGIYVAGFLALVLAVVLSVLGNVWPQTVHMVLQGALSFTSGRLFGSLGGLVIYELVRNLGIILLLGVMGLVWRGKMFASLGKHKSLIAIMMAAFYLAVGGALIYFHFNRVF